jgi:hypothetical protein
MAYQGIDNVENRLTEVGESDNDCRTDKAGSNRILDDGQAFLIAEECHYFCFHYDFLLSTEIVISYEFSQSIDCCYSSAAVGD